MTKPMKTLLTLIALTLWFVPNSRADYMIPAMSVALNEITEILDVQVTGMNDKGEASIEILKTYKSSKQPIKLITGTRLSCTGGSPLMFGMKSGQRYIVLLVKDQLYEESSFFAVKTEQGITKCQIGWYRDKTWLKTKEEWIPLKEFEAKIDTAIRLQAIAKQVLEAPK